jgi:hypothetical protein
MVECLHSLGVPFALMGGMAVAGWKQARFTQDVDLLIASDGTNAEQMVAALKSAGFQPKRTPPVVTVGDSRFMQFLYEPPDAFMDVQIDLLLAETDFQRESLARRQPWQVTGVRGSMSIVSCEDLIIYKLLAGRLIDRADAAALLRTNRTDLDLRYVSKWVRDLGLHSKWTEIWDEAFPGEAPPG